MSRLTLPIAAIMLLISGCSEPAADSASQDSEAINATESVAKFKNREKKLLEQCEKIYREGRVLSIKYSVLIEAYGLNVKEEPFNVDRCSIDAVQQGEIVTSEDVRKKLSVSPDYEAGRNKAIAQSDKPPLDLCWESYCPCDSPQGGPDQLLCDQLRMGKVEPEMLSVGKSMREVRRQVAESDF